MQAILQQCNSDQEKRAQVRLPPPDALTQSKILLARRAEFEKNAVGKRSPLVEICVDRFAKRIAALDFNPFLSWKRFPFKLSQRSQAGNECLLHLHRSAGPP